MARRSPNKSDDRDYHVNLDNGNEPVNESGGTGNAEGTTDSGGNPKTIDGKPVTNIDAIGGSDGVEYATDANGNPVYNKDGSRRKKRGRRSGSSNQSGGKGNNKTLNDAVDTLSKTLIIFHAGLANFMKFEEMALDENEAKDLSKATVNVLDQFDIKPDPRITAIVGLISTASVIYAPRVIIYKAKMADKKKSDKGSDIADIGNYMNVSARS